MSENYLPASAFLREILAHRITLSDDEAGRADLLRVIAMTRDEDVSNRDWAVFLLALTEIDTAEVRETLIHAAADAEGIVAAEAVCGLAQRDPALALPFVQEALRAERVWMPMLEAAELCAHPSLIEDLRGFTDPSDEPFLDSLAAQALAACEKKA